MTTALNPQRPIANAIGVGCEDWFEKCVIKTSKGRSIRCCLGLWSVSAPTAEKAEREARHYWWQYYIDGEYKEHLSNVKLCEGSGK